MTRAQSCTNWGGRAGISGSVSRAAQVEDTMARCKLTAVVEAMLSFLQHVQKQSLRKSKPDHFLAALWGGCVQAMTYMVRPSPSVAPCAPVFTWHGPAGDTQTCWRRHSVSFGIDIFVSAPMPSFTLCHLPFSVGDARRARHGNQEARACSQDRGGRFQFGKASPPSGCCGNGNTRAVAPRTV